MNTNEQTNTKAWLWLPTVYFTRGLPYVIVFLVSLVFFNRMGQSNSTITLITSWAFVPFIMRPLLGRFVTGYATKRLWVLAMELLMAVSMFGISQSITTPYWEIASMLFIFTTACAAVIHDVAVARFYKLSMSRKLPSLSSVHSVFLLMAVVVGMGIPLMLAGNLEVLNRVVEKSWVTTFYFLSITFLLLFIYHTIVLPRPQDKPSIPIRSGLTRRWWLETKTTFMQLPNYVALLSFLLLFLIPEGMRQPFRSLCHRKARTVEQPLVYGVRHYIAQDAVYLPQLQFCFHAFYYQYLRGNRAIWLWFRHYTLYICASLLFTRQIFHLPILLGKCSSSLFAHGVRLVYRHSTRIFGLSTLLRYRCHRECFTIHRGRFLKANERFG